VTSLEDLQGALPWLPLTIAEFDQAIRSPALHDLSHLGLVEVEDAGVSEAGADLDVEGHERTLCSAPMETSLPSAVLFDNDGLLLDTESVWTRAEQDLFERRGLEFTAEHKRELVGTSAEVAGGVLERGLGEPGRAAELIEELNALVVAELEHGVEAMIGARELLDRLKGRGTPVGLVSNSPLIFVQRSLEIVGFAGRFDAVVSAHEVAAPKPAPDPYIEACRRLGVEPGPGVVALEDSPTGVAAARAAGLTVIGVPSIEGLALKEAHHVAESLLDEVVAGQLVL
jgi:HAD superfamily hydrolase (TIGR01509 family)